MKGMRKKKPALTFWHYTIFILMGIFFYVWQQGFVVNLGYQIHSAEEKYKELLMENQQLHTQLVALQNVSAIRQRIREFQLPLIEPKEWNIYYLYLGVAEQ